MTEQEYEQLALTQPQLALRQWKNLFAFERKKLKSLDVHTFIGWRSRNLLLGERMLRHSLYEPVTYNPNDP